MNKLIIIRGLPGSGKTTLARSIKGNDLSFYITEPENYFTDALGRFKREACMDPVQIRKALRGCFWETIAYLESGFNVVVSNNLIRLRELKPYIDNAKRLGSELQVIDMPIEPVLRKERISQYDISFDKILKMAERWQPYPQL